MSFLKPNVTVNAPEIPDPPPAEPVKPIKPKAVSELEKRLNQYDVPSFESVALSGDGVFQTLKMISKLVLLNLKGGLD